MGELLIRAFIKDKDNVADHKTRAEYGKLSGFVGIILNLILFIIKLISGIVSGSVSIIADAINNLSDVSSSVISLLGFKLSEKPADREHPYGHGRYEYLAGLSVSVLIIVIGIELLKSSAKKIILPTEVIVNWTVIITLLFSIVSKLWLMLFNKKIGKLINSKTLIATSKDSRNDVVATLSVLGAILVSRFTPFIIDGWIGVLVALFIMYSGAVLIKDTLNPMLGAAPDEEYVNRIRDRILAYPNVLGMHDLIVHDYGPSRKFASVHIEMAAEEDVLKSHEIIDEIERDFLKCEGLNMIIHYDPIVTSKESTYNLRNELSQIVKSIDEKLSIHDLKVIADKDGINLIFDCIADFDLCCSDDELKEKIDTLVRQKHPEYKCVITIDKSYAPIIR